MNYIQIEMNGHKVGLKFAYTQAKEFAIAIADNVNAYFEGETISNLGIAKLLHTAYRNNCLVKEVKPEHSLEFFSDWVDDHADDEEATKVLVEVLGVWQESKYTKMWIEEVKKKTQEILQAAQSQAIKPKSNMRKSKLRSTLTESESVS